MQGREKKARGDADGFLDVVVLDSQLTLFGLRESKVDTKHDDQVRSRFEELLVPVRTQRRQRLEPFRRHPVLIALALFCLGCPADLTLDFRVLDYDESPRLLIGGAGSQGGAANRILN